MPTSSNGIAIAARGLGKTYRIEHKIEHFTATEALLHRLRHPFKPLRTEELRVLRDVTFDIAQGDVVGIIGRNGAGKSTLFKILSRIVEPTYGEAHIFGRIASLIEVGTGFQPELTGRENIYLNGAILGMRRREIDRHFDAIVDFSGVETFLDTPVKRYSSGMYVRLAFSVAAHLDTDILLVDEVLSVGDADFQKKSLGKMGEVASTGRTVVFVSHNFATLEALCTKGLFLADGEIVQQGPLQEVLAEYSRVMRANQAQLGSGDAAAVNLKGKYEYFRDLDLLDENGNSVRTVAMGSTVKVRFQIETAQAIENPNLSVAIENLLGARAMTLKPPKIGPSSLAGNKLWDITCEIDSLPLAPGDYQVFLILRNGSIELDRTAAELSFEVRNADTFGDGWGYISGTCVARTAWQMAPVGADSQPVNP